MTRECHVRFCVSPAGKFRRATRLVGHPQAGRNLAGLYSLMATCRLHGINPEAYIADVLLRIGSHPQSEIDDLLPQNWTPAA